MARSGNPVAFGPVPPRPTPASAPLQDEARARLQALPRRAAARPPAPADDAARPDRSRTPSSWTRPARASSSSPTAAASRATSPTSTSASARTAWRSAARATRRRRSASTRIVSSKEKLPDFYGPGAFPISYPNEWDKLHRRNGYGIWLHGTPSETYSRPPRATDGCVVLTNDDLRRLARYVDVGRTPVVISAGRRVGGARSLEGEPQRVPGRVRAVARRLGEPRHRALPLALLAAVPRRRQGPRRPGAPRSAR